MNVRYRTSPAKLVIIFRFCIDTYNSTIHHVHDVHYYNNNQRRRFIMLCSADVYRISWTYKRALQVIILNIILHNIQVRPRASRFFPSDPAEFQSVYSCIIILYPYVITLLTYLTVVVRFGVHYCYTVQCTASAIRFNTLL